MTSLEDIIPVGTKLLIHQATAPNGWTKVTGNAYKNAALRIMSEGTFVTSTQTGKVFTEAFKVHTKSYTIQSTISGLNVGNHTLSTPQIPSHTHNMPNAGSGDGVAGNTPSNQGGQRADMGQGTTGAKGGGGNHKHPSSYQSVTGPLQTTHSLNVKYIDVIVCSYDGYSTSNPVSDSGN